MRPVELFRTDQRTCPGAVINQPIRHVMLRPLEPGDADAIHEVVSNWQVARMLAQIPWPYHISHSRAFADYASNSGTAADARYFAIEDGSFNFLGMIGLVEITKTPRVGFFLDQNYWGAGVMTEALSMFCKAAFRELPTNRIVSGVFADNLGSLRVHEKVGFRAVGKSRALCAPRRKLLTRIDFVLNRPVSDGVRYQA